MFGFRITEGNSPPEVGKARQDPANRMGKYIVLGLLGRGGMGAVYKAWDDTLRRWVALKILEREDEEAADRTRFQREAQTSASLDHPGIVRIYEVGRAEGKDFIALEYIEGKTLAQADLPLRVAVQALAEAAEAVSHAHSKGIIHRDLKPHNIMMDRKGRARVMDFGLAKYVEGDESLTVTGTILGTPAYMSPEQAEGGGRKVDHRSDIYSLGAVLYRFLCGRPPFQGDTPLRTLQKVVHEDVIVPSKLGEKVPDALETIVLKCLEKDPNRRYADADLLAQDLNRWVRGEMIQTRRTSSLVLAGRKAKKNRFLLLTSILILFAVGGGVFFLLDKSSHREELLQEARTAFEDGDWERAEVLYEKAGDKDGAGRARLEIIGKQKKLEKKEAADREDKRKREETEKARKAARAEYESGRVRLEKAILDLYREGADLSSRTAQIHEGVSGFTSAIELRPEFIEALFDRGRAFMELREYRKARDDFDRTIGIDPLFSAAYYERGWANLFIWVGLQLSPGATREMVRDGELFRVQSRDDFKSYRGLAGSDPGKVLLSELLQFYVTGSYEKAFSVSSKMIEEGTNNEEVYFVHGLILFGRMSQGKNVALKVLEGALGEAIRRRANYFEAYKARGALRMWNQDFKGALSDFQRADRINPDLPDIHGNIGHCLLRLERWEESEKELKEAIRLNPRNDISLTNLGFLLSRKKKYGESLEYLSRAIGINPESAYSRTTRGSVRLRMKDYEGAIRDHTEAIRISPEYDRSYLNLAAVYYERKIWNHAADNFRKFLKRHRTHDMEFFAALFNLGWCYHSLGLYPQAIECWESLLKLDFRPEFMRKLISESKSAQEKTEK